MGIIKELQFHVISMGVNLKKNTSVMVKNSHNITEKYNCLTVKK